MSDANLKWIIPVGRSPWAIAAGYAGLLGLIVFPAPLALVLSVIAIWHLRRNPKLEGMGRAIFGLVVGIAGTTFLAYVYLSR